MRVIAGVLLAIAFAAGPLVAQGHDHQAQPDTAKGASHGCPMAGMHGGPMMGSRDSADMRGMMADTAMMASMRFAPRVVLAHRDTLALTPEQVSRIEALTHPASDSAMAGPNHMQRARETSAKVQAILTTAQRARLEQLPPPCPMAGGGTEHRH